MKKIIFILAALAVLMLSCDNAMKEPYPNEPNGCDKPERYDCSTGPFKDLKGTEWRAVGFVDIRTGVLRKLDPRFTPTSEPITCMTCFTLRFFDDGYFEGSTVTNGFNGRFKINYEVCSIRLIQGEGHMTLLPDADDAQLFIIALSLVQSFAITTNGELIFYGFLLPESLFHLYGNIINYSYLLFERTDL